MDGNGRWAKQRGLPRIKGHEQGAESVRAVLRAARRAGVRFLTLYAFSTENWGRPQDEVEGLMNLLGVFIDRHGGELLKNKVRLRVMGQPERLPEKVRKKLATLMAASERDFEYTLIMALSYGSRAEITDAVRSIARKVAEGRLDPAAITEQTVAQHLYLPDVPDPELMIRTSGELRLSNFLLWQLSYAELYVTEVLWPDFREEQFMQALEAFQRRDRRYGGVVNR
jgi:undecaprenyl diphosphate synthase